MSLYTNATKTAQRLLKKYGQTVVITKQVEGAYDVDTSSSTITETTQNIKGAVFDWGGSDRPTYGQEVIDGTIIKIGDKKLMLSPLTVEGTPIVPPEIGDVAIVDGVSYTIVNPLKILAPSGVLVLVEANIRGSS